MSFTERKWDCISVYFELTVGLKKTWFTSKSSGMWPKYLFMENPVEDSRLQELQQSSLKHLQCQKDYYFLTDSKTNSMMTSIRRNYFHSYLFCRYLISSWEKFVQLIYVTFFNKSDIRFLLSLHLMWVSSFLVWLCSRCQAQVFMKRFTTNT